MPSDRKMADSGTSSGPMQHLHALKTRPPTRAKRAHTGIASGPMQDLHAQKTHPPTRPKQRILAQLPDRSKTYTRQKCTLRLRRMLAHVPDQ